MRGEKCAPLLCVRCSIGSSPHARGKAAITKNGSFCYRIIPACAGKRHSPCLFRIYGKDHPRMRGEKKISL